MPSLLHGTLSVTIFEVDRIQNGCGFNFFSKGTGQKSCGKKFLSKVKRMVLCRPEIVGSRLYATVDLDKARVGRTRMIENQPYNPQWYESFNIYCAHLISHVIFTVKDDQVVGAELIGRAYIPVEDVIKGYIVDKWVEILDVNRNPIGSRIHVKLHFLSAAHDSNWSQGIKIHAMMEFLTHSSINDRVARDPHRRKPGGDLKLGDLLKKKADEGVRVLMLVWDDRTSVEELKKDGLMATHDQETENYFRNTNVHCFLCPRNPDDGRSIIQGFEISTMFTHHQKTVVVDCEMPDSTSQKRRIVSFVGGIDLCDGRYDTQDHPLFKTLDTIHHDDFHQPNFPGSSIKKGDPGRVYNRPLPVLQSSDTDTWNVQLFRSIDGGAVVGFPTRPEEVAVSGLVSGKDNIIDRSIQDAYINAIRRAKNFIYIENQYFLGSSFGWKSNDIKVKDINALHLIPKELSLKIASKIDAGERFTVYIVIPMWPEGIPESASVQAILDWQRRTMEMMYSDISDALEEMDFNIIQGITCRFSALGTGRQRR
ncbi:hypothetical protein GH714_023819 [Hevea brasiliensis]|uniref:phospholipase D n=1 Tax=Hevea brasiliensis TaxID=3981 RepID=A0A6A6LS54_HEVBR|nr:hypothetical protein GH714_023819 [Hevea brasiliensis]